jgi:translation initiation factor IF-2
MSKLRVYSLAKELGMENKALVAFLQSIGVSDIRNHMSALSPEQVERVRRHFARPGDQPVVEQRLQPRGGSGPVIIRRGRRKDGSDSAEAPASVPSQPVPVAPVVRRAAPKAAPAQAPPPVEAKAKAKAPPAPAPEPAPQPARPAVEPPAPVEAPAVEPKAVAEPPPAPTPAPRSEPVAAAPPPEPVPEPPKPKPTPKPKPQAAAPPPPKQPEPQPAPRPSSPPKTGIDVWEGRPGVPMPQPARTGVTPRRVQYDAKAGGPNGRRGVGGPPMRRGPGPRRGIGAMRKSGGGNASVTQERSAHKKVVKIEETIALQQLAAKIGVKAGQVLMKLMGMGMTGVNINSALDSDTAKIVANEFGWTVEDVAVTEDEAIALAQGEVEDEDKDRLPRPPVVSVMGHVDHGKTSLLDRIRKSSVVTEEAGGITQHIGAYSVKTSKGRITFLDTPGHAAFSQMRARGARCTDIVVLVVAADDGVMPQTKEAINHAKEAKCPIVVAINKVDKPDAQPERIRRELSELGLTPEEWGGDTLFVEVSAIQGTGLDALLDAVLLQGDMLELRANPKRPATGTVIEAKLDRGRGPVATVLVTDGTLVKGAGLLVGASWGRVRAMLDENGRNVAEAGPSTPVSVIGLNEVPAAGDTVNAVQDAKKAQEIADSRRTKERRSLMSTSSKVSLEEMARRMKQADAEELKVIVKADVQGSVEAVHTALEGLSTETVQVNVVHSAVGAVTEGDVNLAVAAGAIIVAFNVRPAGKAALHAQREGIEIRQYSIIYNAMDDIKATMEGLLAPNLVEEAIGEAEVRKVFHVSKAGVVAGCMVINGVVRRNALARVRREGEVVWEGKLDSLKRFKDDAREVREGLDCGISLQGFNDVAEGDVIAVFEMKEVRQTL